MNVLYVASDKKNKDAMCPGSIVCLAIAEKFSEDDISIQNCDILREQTDEIPDWLNGTPLFINEEEGIPYRGKDAIDKMNTLGKKMKRSNKVENPHGMTQINSRIENENSNIPQQNTENVSSDPLDDHFKMDVQPQEEQSSGKITEHDLQKFMELRNNSPASAQPNQSNPPQ
tara:strand:- start:429 stop:944 length:516 start_codon:yes stop_codon:yes gene_type:complete